MASNSYRNKYRSQQNKRKHTYKIEPGMLGFLCTCDTTKEKNCVRESYNILNEYADKLFGAESWREKKETKAEEAKDPKVEDPKDAEDDIDSSLAEEIKSLKAEKSQPLGARRFQVVESGANGIVFVKTTVPDPVALAHSVMTSIAEKRQQSKFLLRLLPVEITCKAYLHDITSSCNTLFDKYFSGEPKTFAIVFNHRNNDSLKREELIEKVAELISNKNEEHKTDLKQPQLAVLIEVIRSICCISVVPDYYLLRKYNLLELASKGSSTGQAKDESKADGDKETQSSVKVAEFQEEKEDVDRNEKIGDAAGGEQSSSITEDQSVPTLEETT